MKAPILIIIPQADSNEIAILQKLIIDVRDTSTFKDRLFVLLDSDISKLLSSPEQLINLATSINQLKYDLHEQGGT